MVAFLADDLQEATGGAFHSMPVKSQMLIILVQFPFAVRPVVNEALCLIDCAMCLEFCSDALQLLFFFIFVPTCLRAKAVVFHAGKPEREHC